MSISWCYWRSLETHTYTIDVKRYIRICETLCRGISSVFNIVILVADQMSSLQPSKLVLQMVWASIKRTSELFWLDKQCISDLNKNSVLHIGIFVITMLSFNFNCLEDKIITLVYIFTENTEWCVIISVAFNNKSCGLGCRSLGLLHECKVLTVYI